MLPSICVEFVHKNTEQKTGVKVIVSVASKQEVVCCVLIYRRVMCEKKLI